MKQQREWVFGASDGKKHLKLTDAQQYCRVQGLAEPRRVRYPVWTTEDGSKFIEYDKAFEHEAALV